MAEVTRLIGLSLGADVCWPICYEEILRRLDLRVPSGGDTLRFEAERVTIEPFDLQQPCKYEVVIDRLTHWYSPTREWIKKSVILDDLYVYNNPWSLQSMEKQTTYCAMMRLGLPVPRTWMIPAKEYEHSADLDVTLERYAKLFDLEEIGEQIGYPVFMKPYHGGGWVGVTKIDNAEQLKAAYDASGKTVMNVQKAVLPHDFYVRAVGLGPQVRLVNYAPSAPLHDRYTLDVDFVGEEDASLLEDMTLTINSFFGWDFNSCEALRQGTVWHPIDYANACPDSQVTSLHYHFPWLIKANLRWSIFCAATERRFYPNLDFSPYYEIAEQDLPYRERLRAYAKIAHKRFETERFEEFCAKHLSHLDEVAAEFFRSPMARDAVHSKVAALFPDHEIDTFTELFWERIQRYLAVEGTSA
ncbi:MAG: hypothetical protein AAFX85_02275 [Pseudomonadota bacterium]